MGTHSVRATPSMKKKGLNKTIVRYLNFIDVLSNVV